MKSILITGCNRGLGLGLVKQLVARASPPENLITTCRDIQKAEELRSIAERNKNVRILQLDPHAVHSYLGHGVYHVKYKSAEPPRTMHIDIPNLVEFDKYPDFAKKVSDIVKENGLNVLFNNAGISPKSTRINFVKVEQLVQTFTTNTVVPIMLTKALLSSLKRAASQNSTRPFGVDRAAVVNMSSMLGSVELNTHGGLYPYRCSKAALNITTKSMNLDLKNEGILVTCLHPGWVKTEMGGANAPMEINESTSQLVNLLYNLNETHGGGFYQWDGTPLPW